MNSSEYKSPTVRSAKPLSEHTSSLAGARSIEEGNSNSRAEKLQFPSGGFGHQASTATSNNFRSQGRKRNMDGITLSSPSNKKSRRATSSQPDESEHPPSANGERPRLTEQEKKNNHIASEQKRRQAIREGFDRLTELVPGLEGQGRSESVVLRKSVDFMRKEVEERRKLVARIEALGGEVPENYKEV
jgi:heteromeric Ino2p/Ino4p transcription factor